MADDEEIIELVQKDQVILKGSNSFDVHAKTEEKALTNMQVSCIYFLAKYDTSTTNARLGIGLYSDRGVLIQRWEAPSGKLQNLNKSFSVDDKLVSNMTPGCYYTVEYKADNKDSFGDDAPGEPDFVKFYSYRLMIHAVPIAATIDKTTNDSTENKGVGFWKCFCCAATTNVEPTVPQKSPPQSPERKQSGDQLAPAVNGIE